MPEITTTLGALAAAAPALARLAAQELPVKTAVQLARITKAAQAEIDLFYEQRNAAIKELGEERASTPDEIAAGASGPVVQVKAEHLAAYTERVNELGKIATVLQAEPIDLVALEKISISAADVIALGALVKEPV